MERTTNILENSDTLIKRINNFISYFLHGLKTKNPMSLKNIKQKKKK